MIVARVKLKQPQIKNRWIDESPINGWLNEQVGSFARFHDQVDESRPWHLEHTAKELIYSFAREKDAIMFSLRWSQ
jgi:hypothetical protein